MAKIILNNKEYNIDDTVLASINNELKNHFMNVINGLGATIKLGGVTYGVDGGKLSTATANLATHLGTISGSGKKVVIGGVEYSVSSEKVSGAVADLETVFGELGNGGQERLDGDGQEFHTMAPSSLSFRSTAPLDELVDVKINGEVVDPSNYTLTEGSTIVTFPIDYLQGLLQGKHEVTVESQNGSASGDFIVVDPDLNEYGFYYNQPYTTEIEVPIEEGASSKAAFFLREDGTFDLIFIKYSLVVSGTFTCDGKNAIMNLGNTTFTGTWSDDGKSVYCNELQVNSTLGDASIFADTDFMYTYDEALGGYKVAVIDKTKSHYNLIKDNINDVKTVAIADAAF